MSQLVLVSGPRDWTDVGVARTIFEGLELRYPTDWVLMHGGAPTGLDHIAEVWANEFLPQYRHRIVPAKWEKHGKRAGHLRNFRMVKMLPDLAIFFRHIDQDWTPGTGGCRKMAINENLHRWEIAA